MLSKLKRNIAIDEWQRPQAAVGHQAHSVTELLAYQNQMVRALAQGTPWAAGRIPLSFRPSPYQVRVGESRFFAPSALDCLRLPALLGESIEVTSVCPTNGQAICLIITEQGLGSHEPSGCVMSLVGPRMLPGRMFDRCDDSSNEERQLTHFFSSREAASLWLVAYPGVDVLGIDQAWRLVNGIAHDNKNVSLAGIERDEC